METGPAALWMVGGVSRVAGSGVGSCGLDTEPMGSASLPSGTPGYRVRIEGKLDGVSVGWVFCRSFLFLANSLKIKELLKML